MHTRSFQWRLFAAACVAVVAVIGIAWVLVPPSYDTNDDVTIRLGVEGALVPGQPATGFVLLTHAALGWGVAGLHAAAPAVPWWDLVVAGTLLWAVAVAVTLAWGAAEAGGMARAVALAAAGVSLLPVLFSLQFTISAVLGGGAAMALAVAEWLGARRGGVLAMAAALLLASLLVRALGAVTGALTVALCLMPLLLGSSRERWKQLGAVVALGTIASAAFAAVAYSDELLYRTSPEWDAYYRFNWMVVRLFEWGGEMPPADAAAVRSTVGWSANDWEMLQRYWAVDAEVHGYSNLSAAYDATVARRGSVSVTGRIQPVRAAAGIADVRGLLVAVGPLVAAALLAASVLGRLRGAAAAAASAIGFALLCVAIDAATKDLPFRLLAPMGACFTIAVVTGTGSGARRPGAAFRVAALAAVLTILSVQIPAVMAAAVAENRHGAQVAREIDALQALQPSLLVRHADSFPAEHWWRPFRRPTARLDSIALGWNNQNPLLQAFLEETGRRPLYAALCHDPRALIVTDEGRLDPVTTYARERLGSDITWSRVFEGSFTAWRCTMTAAGNAAGGP